MDYIRLGILLRDARVAARFTQDDAAQRIGKTPQTVSLWEKGKSKIDIEALASLCQMYNTPLSSILISAGADFPNSSPLPTSPLQDSLLISFSQLNQEGQERLVEIADDMVSSGKYTKAHPQVSARVAARGGGVKSVPVKNADTVTGKIVPTEDGTL